MDWMLVLEVWEATRRSKPPIQATNQREAERYFFCKSRSHESQSHGMPTGKLGVGTKSIRMKCTPGRKAGQRVFRLLPSPFCCLMGKLEVMVLLIARAAQHELLSPIDAHARAQGQQGLGG